MKKVISLVAGAIIIWLLFRYFNASNTPTAKQPESPAKQAAVKKPEVDIGLGMTTIPTGMGMRYLIVKVTQDAPPATRYPVNQTCLVTYYCTLQVGLKSAKYHDFAIVVKYPNSALLSTRLWDQEGYFIYLDDGPAMLRPSGYRGRRRITTQIVWGGQGYYLRKIVGGEECKFRVIEVLDYNLIIPLGRSENVKPIPAGTAKYTGEQLRAYGGGNWDVFRGICEMYVDVKERHQAIQFGTSPLSASPGGSGRPSVVGHGMTRQQINPPVVTPDPRGQSGSR